MFCHHHSSGGVSLFVVKSIRYHLFSIHFSGHWQGGAFFNVFCPCDGLSLRLLQIQTSSPHLIEYWADAHCVSCRVRFDDGNRAVGFHQLSWVRHFWLPCQCGRRLVRIFVDAFLGHSFVATLFLSLKAFPSLASPSSCRIILSPFFFAKLKNCA